MISKGELSDWLLNVLDQFSHICCCLSSFYLPLFLWSVNSVGGNVLPKQRRHLNLRAQFNVHPWIRYARVFLALWTKIKRPREEICVLSCNYRLHFRRYRSSVFHTTELTIESIYSYLIIYETLILYLLAHPCVQGHLFILKDLGYSIVLYMIFSHFSKVV